MVVSTVVFSGLLYGLTFILGIDIPLIYCFLFGALISPTDPIAVAAILKKSKIPERLETIIIGESMFNDAVGLILFVTLFGIADQPAGEFSIAESLKMFAVEVIGGIAIGWVAGFMGYRLIRSIDDFQTIFLITIALVLGISVIASKLHASVPLAAVTSGLFIGNQNFGKDKSAERFLDKIWHLLDEMLNTILFVMIGLQLILLPFLDNYWLIGLISIVLVLVSRLLSVSVTGLVLLGKINKGNLSILTWAGIKGGISVALALSLPENEYKKIILSACYIVVVFSIIAQGLTLNKVVERATREDIEVEKA